MTTQANAKSERRSRAETFAATLSKWTSIALLVISLYFSIGMAATTLPYYTRDEFRPLKPTDSFDFERLHLWMLASYTSLDFASGEFSNLTIKHAEYKRDRFPFLLHSGLGIVAVVIGYHQICTYLRNKNISRHRLMGYMYHVALVFVLYGASARIYRDTPEVFFSGPLFWYGLLTYTLSGYVTIIVGYTAIRMKMIERHRQWILLNYSLVWGAPLYRFGYGVLYHINTSNMVETLNPCLIWIYAFTEVYLCIGIAYHQNGKIVLDSKNDVRNIRIPEVVNKYLSKTSEFFRGYTVWNVVTNVCSWVYLKQHVFPHVPAENMVVLATIWVLSSYLGSRLLENCTMSLANNRKQRDSDGSRLLASYLSCQILVFGLIVWNLYVGMDGHVVAEVDPGQKFQTIWFWFMKLFQIIFFNVFLAGAYYVGDVARTWEWCLHSVWGMQMQWCCLASIVFEVFLSDFELAFSCATLTSVWLQVVLTFLIVSICSYGNDVIAARKEE